MSTPGSPRIEVLRQLSDAEVAAVSALVDDVTESDGVRPLSEHVMLHLRYGGDTNVRHVMAWDDVGLVGYGHLDVTDPVDGSSAELAVAPRMRGHGVGRMLVQHLHSSSPDGRLRLWAHGEHASAGALATAMGFTRVRVLWQMRRNLFAALPAPVIPDGVTLRTFVPGVDDDAWLALNAAAFADHPEQGAWTHRDLDQRLREHWFDPHGFFIAEESQADAADAPGHASPDDAARPQMIGFHWTKVHGGELTHAHDEHGVHTHHEHGHDPIGEIYVIGVDPAVGGRGLGRALALAGLRHLRGLGLSEAMLYVEADNAAAIALYESLGFRHWDTDVMYAAADPGLPAS